MRQNLLCFFVLPLIFAFKWPWQDDETTSLQSALPTSSSKSPSSTAEFSGTSDAIFTSSYFADGQAYAPKATACPTAAIMRKASDISQQEAKYIKERQKLTNENLITFLDKVADLSDFDAEDFIQNASKNISIGLAFSGGGYRAMLSGAGSLLALDDRFEDSEKTALGGLLQCSTYISGLSGGAWLVGSLAVNNWISVADVMAEESGLWDLSDSIFNPSGLNLVKTISYYSQLRQAISAKKDAGFQTSITDVWGRALSYQLFNDSFYNGGENFTWTGVTQSTSFQDHEMPYPILVANGRNPGTKIINLNSTVFEMTPHELGSWDPSLNSFVDNRYLGTNLSDGQPNGQDCVTNYDNAGFFMGTSSSIFNQIFLNVQSSSSLNWALRKLLSMILGSFSKKDTDIATYEPNPFYNSSYADSETMITSDALNLVDGGEDNQNVPYYPLIQNSRNVDVIFSFDNSADTAENWPNGSAITYTFKRQFTIQGYGTPFPYVPSYDTFIKEKLDSRPVFFGCNASELDDLVQFHGSPKNTTDVPLIVYIPASEYSYEANTSTYKMSYDDDEKLGVIQNGFEVASMNNRSRDSRWNKCVGCAIIRREQERSGQAQTDECKKCFSEYCWVGGVEDSAEPNASVLLDIVTERNSNSAPTSSSSSSLSRNDVMSAFKTTRESTKSSLSSTKMSSKNSKASASTESSRTTKRSELVKNTASSNEISSVEARASSILAPLVTLIMGVMVSLA
ncbi:hypothetical protein OXX59_002969 [Metschnikowia pulcherrima]